MPDAPSIRIDANVSLSPLVARIRPMIPYMSDSEEQNACLGTTPIPVSATPAPMKSLLVIMAPATLKVSRFFCATNLLTGRTTREPTGHVAEEG